MYECDQRDPSFGACVGSSEGHEMCQFQEFERGRYVRTHLKLNPNYIKPERLNKSEGLEKITSATQRTREHEREQRKTEKLTPIEDMRPALRDEAGDTEEEAAQVVMPHVGTQCRQVLDAIYESGDYGRTDEENELGIPVTRSSSSARRGSLYKGGWVEEVGGRRPTRSGVRAKVWVMTTEGRERYELERMYEPPEGGHQDFG